MIMMAKPLTDVEIDNLAAYLATDPAGKSNINNKEDILMLQKSNYYLRGIFSCYIIGANGQADTMGTPKISAMSIVNGLENPWDMAFTKNGDMLFTEKCKGFCKNKSGKINKLYGMKGSSGYNSAGDDCSVKGKPVC